MTNWFYDLYCFIFPTYCPVCGIPLYVRNQLLCLDCERRLPRTNYVSDPKNPVFQQFWGRVKVEGATSLFRFEKGSRYQSLLHELKYKGNRKLGVFLGKLLGEELLKSEFSEVDYIIPVPLHRKKRIHRGYNQCEVICEGLSEMLKKPVQKDILARIIHTSSQTSKGRLDRWKNIEGVFELSCDPEEYIEATFLLIDDVTTTGATLEVCSAELLKIPGVKVYIATIACA